MYSDHLPALSTDGISDIPPLEEAADSSVSTLIKALGG